MIVFLGVVCLCVMSVANAYDFMLMRVHDCFFRCCVFVCVMSVTNSFNFKLMWFHDCFSKHRNFIIVWHIAHVFMFKLMWFHDCECYYIELCKTLLYPFHYANTLSNIIISEQCENRVPVHYAHLQKNRMWLKTLKFDHIRTVELVISSFYSLCSF